MLEALTGQLFRDRLMVMRFGLVGLAATGIHLGVAFAVQGLLHHPFVANLVGFLAAFAASFLGHALWTF